MLKWSFVILGLASVLIAAEVQAAASSSRGSTEQQPGHNGDKIRRGEYLVHSVAMCVQCHTPRNDRGELVQSQLLQGAPLPVTSPWPDQKWAVRTPALAALPGGWSEQDVIKFLMTGEDPTGRSPQPPMPPFRMNREDAAAVAAYLRSLQPSRR
jgi:mono/diheme cytochrome c family protein